jgi:hypothetical protein
MNTNRTLMAVLLVALRCVAGSADAQVIPVVGTITEITPVTLLPEPGRTPLATLDVGAQVRVLGAAERGWYKISFDHGTALGPRIGYVRAEHVKVSTSDLAALTLRNGLSAEEIVKAISSGRARNGRRVGLRLMELDETPVHSQSADVPGGQLRVDIHTPLSWIQQLASEAARDNRKFSLEDVTADMSAPLLRVTVYSDAPHTGAETGSPIRNVVLRAVDKAVVVRPLTKEAFSQHRLKAFGGAESSEVLRLTFPLDAVRELRGPLLDREFLITVTDARGDDRDFHVRKARYADLPM